MNNIKFIDAHCDTIVKCNEKNKELFENDLHIDLKRLKDFSYLQTFAIWLDKKYYNNAYVKTCEYIDFYYNEINKNNNIILPIYNYDDILNIINNNKLGALLSIEGGEAIEGSIEKLEYFYNKGVRMMTLTWNNKNQIGYGSDCENIGLTDFGKSVVKNMQKLGMIVDISHLSDKGFFDVYDITEKPFIASHSNSRKICNSKRNLTDEQIKAIRDVNGVIGINIYSNFISEKKYCDIDDIIKHIDYIISITDDNILGLGCDFDGIDNTPKDLYDVSCINKIICRLECLYGRETTEKIAWKNFDRVFSEIL